ncbi:MAG: RNA polymerase sigma factor [Clostridia bacterium]|nr:RNA polymerase sigma factor [Clostridia bacterium]
MDNGACSYRRFLDGQDEGIVEIVQGYKDGLILYLNSVVGNVLLAEELAEDTFFRLMVKKPRFSGKSVFKTWLYAIGRHVALDALRRRAKLADAPIEDAEEVLADKADLERDFLREERRILVHRTMERLPADYRQILWLSYFEGLSSAEAAAVMGKNDRQIRNLLYRAKQSLKTELEQEGFTYEDV